MTHNQDFVWRRMAEPAVGVITTLVLWELIGRSHMFGAVWPPLTAVLRAAMEPTGREVLLSATAATVPDAVRGLIVGLLLGSSLALAAHLIPPLARGVAQIAVLVQAVPVIAVTPFLLTTLDRGAIPSTLAAVGALFASFVSLTAGFPPHLCATATSAAYSAPASSPVSDTSMLRPASHTSSKGFDSQSRVRW